MRQLAKFLGDRSNRCGDMTIFVQYGRVCHLVLVVRVTEQHKERLVVFITVQNLVGIDQ